MIETGTATSGIRVVAELAEEEEDDNADQHEGDDERADDLVDGRRHEHGGVEEHAVGHVVGEALSQLFHDLANLARHLDGIGARRLVDADRGRRRAIEAAVAVQGLGAELDPRHVLHPHHRAVADWRAR